MRLIGPAPITGKVSTAAIDDDAITTAKILDGTVALGDVAFGVPDATDMRLAFLMIAENQGDRLSMNDGIADPLKDETDIDTSTSANESYDADGDYYVNTSPFTLLDLSGLTETADGIGAVTRTAAKFDGDLDQASSATTNWNLDASAFAFGVDHGSGVTVAVAKATYTSPNDGNGGFFAAASGGNLTWKMQGSTDDSSWVDLGGNLTDDYPYSDTSRSASHEMTSTTAYRYHRVHVTKNSGGNGYLRLAEAQFYTVGATNNMTIVSNAFTATTAPDTGRIHIQVNPIVSITINTDLTAEISRGNNEWTAATLVLKETLKDGTLAYEANSVDISSQTSATAMKYRVKTLNNKKVELHGVVLQWA